MNRAQELTGFLSNVANTKYQFAKDRAGTNFGVKLSGPDPQDRKYDLLKNIIEPGAVGAVPKTKDGLVPIADDQYYEYVKRKIDAELEANYEGWVMNQIDMSSPEKVDHWTRIVPFVQEKREKVLEEQAEIQKRLAYIKLRGPRDENDMKLLFAVHTGLVNVADAPLYKLEDEKTTFMNTKAGAAAVGPSTSFNAGILSPWSKYFHSTDAMSPLEKDTTLGVVDFKNPIGPLEKGKTAFGSIAAPKFSIAGLP